MSFTSRYLNVVLLLGVLVLGVAPSMGSKFEDIPIPSNTGYTGRTGAGHILSTTYVVYQSPWHDRIDVSKLSPKITCVTDYSDQTLYDYLFDQVPQDQTPVKQGKNKVIILERQQDFEIHKSKNWNGLKPSYDLFTKLDPEEALDKLKKHGGQTCDYAPGRL